MNRELDHLIDYLEKQGQALDELAKAAHHRPSPARIHQIRVVVRRLRAALWLLSHSLHGAHFAAVDHALRLLGHSLGPVRELDVAMREAPRFGFAIRELSRERRKREESVRRLLTRKRRKRLGRKLARAAKRARARHEIRLAFALQQLQTRITVWRHTRLESSGQLHRFRISLKKTRYALEGIGSRAPRLERLQHLLGREHDLALLESRVGGNAILEKERSRFATQAHRHSGPAIREALRRLGGAIRA